MGTGTIDARGGVRRLAAMGLSEAAVLGCGFTLQSALSRRLEPAGYGLLASLNVALLFPLLLAAGGMPRAARNLVAINPGNFVPACGLLARRHLPACAAMAAAAAVPGWLIATRRAGGAAFAPVALVLAEGLIRCAVLEPCLYLLNGLHRQDLHGRLIAAHAALRLACVGSAAWASLGLAGAAWGGVVAAAIAAVAACLLVNAIAIPPGEPDVDFAARALEWARRAPAFELLNYLPLAANLWLVEWLVPGGRAAGVYAACFLLAQSALALGRASVAATAAALAREIALARPDRARSLVAQTLRGLALAVMPALAVAVARGDSLVAWAFGPAYVGGGALLAPLLVGVIGAGTSLFIGEVVGIAGGLGLRQALAAGVGLGASIVAGLAIPPAGPAGGAWALALYGLAASTAMGLAARRSIGPLVPWASVGRASCAAAPLVVLVRADGGFGPFLALACLGMVAYAVALACLGEFASPRPAGLPAPGPPDPGPSGRRPS